MHRFPGSAHRFGFKENRCLFSPVQSGSLCSETGGAVCSEMSGAIWSEMSGAVWSEMSGAIWSEMSGAIWSEIVSICKIPIL